MSGPIVVLDLASGGLIALGFGIWAAVIVYLVRRVGAGAALARAWRAYVALVRAPRTADEKLEDQSW